MNAHFEQAERHTCGCGSPWRNHCSHRLCHWLKCSRKGCSGLFDLRKRRFWIRTEHLAKTS